MQAEGYKPPIASSRCADGIAFWSKDSPHFGIFRGTGTPCVSLTCYHPSPILGTIWRFPKSHGNVMGATPSYHPFSRIFHEINHPSSWGSPCKVGINQTCGVDGCYCDVLSDLLCVEPPLPKQICVKARLRGWKCVGGSVDLVLVGYMLAI